MRRHRIQHLGCRRTVSWLRGLSIFVCLLAIIGAGLADDFALAQRNVGSPLETSVAEIPITAADSSDRALQAGCAAQVVCSVFIAVADVQPDIWERKSAGIPLDSRFRSGRTIRPISPPPKPLRQALDGLAAGLSASGAAESERRFR